jgi:carbamate kinase
VRVVVALGGNALLERAERPEAEIQEHHVSAAVRSLTPIAEQHQLLVTHGNGPQVGVLANESAEDPMLRRPYPMDVVGAQTQGMIGYWLLQALENALPERRVAAVLTQTVVDAGDPAFAEPSKFVGSTYDQKTARMLSAARGWRFRMDEHGWRRVVPSPDPLEVVELPTIRSLLESGSVVVCSGGGGIPVVRNDDGRLHGVDGVVDKDLTAALLATQLEADALLILTDVTGVEEGHGTAAARVIPKTSVSELRQRHYPAGSMGPKVRAACRFVEVTGGLAAIGPLGRAYDLLEGRAGTTVVSG